MQTDDEGFLSINYFGIGSEEEGGGRKQKRERRVAEPKRGEKKGYLDNYVCSFL